jgi:outer membrane lipoprotein-sorting protein
MRKLLIFAFVVVGVFASQTRAQIIPEIMTRMEMHNKALQSVKASITMVKTESTVGESDTYSGTITYMPKSSARDLYARLDWLRPVEESIAVQGDMFEMYNEKKNLVYWGKTDKASGGGKGAGLLSLLSMSKAQLKENYNVVYLGTESITGSISTWHLQLNPKGPVSFKFAELWVDTDGMPRQSKIVEKNKDSTTINLSSIKKNERVQMSLFKLTYPKTVVKQRV